MSQEPETETTNELSPGVHEHYESMLKNKQLSLSDRILAAAGELSMVSEVLLRSNGDVNQAVMQEDFESLTSLRSSYRTYLKSSEEGYVEVYGRRGEVCIDIKLGFTQKQQPGVRRKRDKGSLYRIDQARDGAALQSTIEAYPYSVSRRNGRQDQLGARTILSSQEGLGLYYPARALKLARMVVEISQ